jgi:hypothetical protein
LSEAFLKKAANTALAQCVHPNAALFVEQPTIKDKRIGFRRSTEPEFLVGVEGFFGSETKR